MVISLSEMKNYLRVDHDDDDRLLSKMMETGQRLCMDVARTEDEDAFEDIEGIKTAVLFAVAYLYEPREEGTISFTVRYCSNVSGITSTGYRILFKNVIYNIISVDHMNYKKKSMKQK